jgi:hypothetical protein
VLENQDRALKVLDEAIDEMCQNNWDDVLGLIEDEGIVNDMLKKQENWRRL